MPEEFAGTVAAVREAMPDGVSVFVRTSDSLGLAVSMRFLRFVQVQTAFRLPWRGMG